MWINHVIMSHYSVLLDHSDHKYEIITSTWHPHAIKIKYRLHAPNFEEVVVLNYECNLLGLMRFHPP